MVNMIIKILKNHKLIDPMKTVNSHSYTLTLLHSYTLTLNQPTSHNVDTRDPMGSKNTNLCRYKLSRTTRYYVIV